MYTLKNDTLEIAIKKTGAELCKIQSVKHKTNFMWDGNPDIWSSYAPNLFPIIGALKNGEYVFNKKRHSLPKHGIIRHNEHIELYNKTDDCLAFRLVYNENSLKMYPFKFEFYISFKLINNTLEISHTIKNIDNQALYFSLGGHPAFKCPVFNDENYDDYSLLFEHIENSKTHLINMENGLISSKTETAIKNSDTLKLTHDLFNKDALIFKDLNSKTVKLNSQKHGNFLTVNYHDFDYLGVWAKPSGNFVCIEPWLGIADHENSNQRLETKEGIIKLEANDTFKATYSIQISNTHLQ